MKSNNKEQWDPIESCRVKEREVTKNEDLKGDEEGSLQIKWIDFEGEKAGSKTLIHDPTPNEPTTKRQRIEERLEL